MRRFVILLALGLLAAAPPAEELSALARSRPDRWLDPVADAGADPDGDMRSNRVAVQRCLDAAAAVGGGSVRLRDGLVCDRPVSLTTGARIDAAGIGRLVFPQSPGLVTLSPAPLGHAVAPADLVDGAPHLDGSVAGRLGVRLDGRATVAELGGPFSALARRELTAITVEFAFADPGLSGPHGLAVGWSEQGAPRPVWLATDSSGEVIVALGLADGTWPVWRVAAPSLRTPGTHRVAFQADVTAGRTWLRVDGDTLAIPGLPPDPAARLATADRVPLKAGGLSSSPANCYSDYVTIAPQGAVLLGLAVTPSARDAWDGPPPARTDRATYFEPPAGACLRLDDDPADVIATRSLLVGGDYRGAAMLLAPEHANMYASPGHIRVAGLAVEAAGDALAWGLGIDSRVEDCTLVSQIGTAIGGWRCGANYAIRAERLRLQGREYAVSLDYAMWRFRDLSWDVTGRGGILAINTKLIVDDLTVGGHSYGDTRTVLDIRGGSVEVNRADIDVEDGTWPTRAMVDLVGRADAQNATGITASFSNLGFGRLPATTPLWRCRTGPDRTPCVLRVDRPGTSGAGTGGAILADVDRPECWSLSIDRATLGRPERFPIRLGPAAPPDADTGADP